MNRLKVGIIGCGKQAEKHLSGLKKLSGMEFVVADIKQEAAQALSNKGSVPCARDPEDLFLDKSVRAVVICTPTPAHIPLIKKAVKAGKDVFCEKPLSGSIDEVFELQTTLKNSDRIVMIGYIYRYVPVFEEGYRLFQKLDAGGYYSLVMGKPLTAFFRLGGRGSHQKWKHIRATDGGAVNEMLVHMIDLANWYFGPLSDVQMLSNSLKLPQRTINGESVHVDAEDYVVVKCTGANGVEIICQ